MEDISIYEVRSPAKSPWLVVLLAVGACGALGYVAWKSMEQTDLATASRDRVLAEKSTVLVELTRHEERLKVLEAEKAELDARAQQLQANLAQTEAALKRLEATHDLLQDKLKAEIGRGDVRLSQNGDRLQVDLVDKILFDSGEATVSRRGQEVLGRLAEVLKNVEDKQIQVSGHTDNEPIRKEELRKQFPTNWELSVARAVNVVRCMSETGGVPSQRLLAAGYGEFHPLGKNSTAAGRAQNRRIEILLIPTLTAKKVEVAAPTAVAPAAVAPAAPVAKAPDGN